LCEFCTKHGEGKKWYEVMENYSAEFLAVSSRQEYINRFVPNVRNNADANIKKLVWAKKRLPFAYRFIRSIGIQRMKKKHFGQVIPLEDAEKVVELVQSVTRVPCICRNVATGDHNARYCLLLGIDPTGLVRDWPEIESSLEALTPLEAKRLLKEFDEEGLVHSVWTFETPFIGAICNCDYDCLAYRIQVKEDLLNMMFKGEYIAIVDPELCVGCKKCLDLCQFDSVEYSPGTKKCSINPLKCYGCGVCRSSCKKEAISLLDKADFPHLQGVW
jgi:NAD-dependent dihydropyrimidine dehydrogenase PreA subunit